MGQLNPPTQNPTGVPRLCGSSVVVAHMRCEVYRQCTENPTIRSGEPCPRGRGSKNTATRMNRTEQDGRRIEPDRSGSSRRGKAGAATFRGTRRAVPCLFSVSDDDQAAGGVSDGDRTTNAPTVADRVTSCHIRKIGQVVSAVFPDKQCVLTTRYSCEIISCHSTDRLSRAGFAC